MPTRFSWIVAGILLLPALVESAAVVPKTKGLLSGIEPNRGQASAPVRYLLRGWGAYLTADSMVFSPLQVGFRFLSPNPSPTEFPSDPVPGLLNVYRKSLSAGAITGIPRFGTVEFQQIYPGVSVTYTIRNQKLICRLTFAPGASIDSVKMEAVGVGSIDGSGDWLNLRFSSLVIHSLRYPVGFVIGPSGRTSVTARFVLTGERGFRLEMDAAGTELQREIEFTLKESLGTGDYHLAAAAGPSGSIYVAGGTSAVVVGGTPVRTALDPALEICSWTSPAPAPCSDAYVAKFNATGDVVWITYLHGLGGETAEQVKLDSHENVYVAGGTESSDFPVTSNAVQTTYGGPAPPVTSLAIEHGWNVPGDMFLSRLNPADGTLVFSTLLGGPEPEYASRLRVDGDGNPYIFGWGADGTPTTSSAMRRTPPRSHGQLNYVAKLDPSGTRLLYATFLAALPMAVDVDAAGSVYFAGSADVGEIQPTADAYQKVPSEDGDGFVAKLTKDGSALEYATYIGGVDYDYTSDLAVDSKGRAWAHTVTWINGQCCGNATYRLVKLDERGSRILIESHGGEVPAVVDAQDNLWVTAWPPTTALAPTSDAYLAKDSGHGITAKLSPDWRVLFATYPAETIYGLDPGGFPLVRTSSGVGILDLSAHIPNSLACVVNSANWLDSYIAPGQLATLFGKGLGPQQGVAYTLGSDGRVGTSLAGTRVLVDGIPAPVLYAQAEQVNVIVPFSTPTSGSLKVTAEYQGQPVATTSVTSAVASFAFFTLDGSGKGQVAAYNEDGTLNSPSNPAKLGSIVSLWGTGAGQTTPPSVDGTITGYDPPSFEATAMLAQTPATVVYAGAAPGLVAGVAQVNIRIPPDYSDTRYPLTAVPLSIGIKGNYGQSLVTIAVK